MTIRLGSNVSSLSAWRKLAEGTAALAKTFERLSSGQRINRASDDAAGLSIADSLNARSRIYNQGVRNLNDGQSLLSIADSAIESLSGIVIRLEELAEQAANGVYTNKQRKAMDDEAQALSKEFFRISKTTEFNGQRLLTGEFESVKLQAGVGQNAVLSAGVGGAIGTGRFGTATSFITGAGPADIHTGDFNGDGHMDAAVACYSSQVAVMLGNGSGTLRLDRTYSVGTSPTSVLIKDFNNDGNLDLVTSNFGDNSIGLLLGSGNGTFAAEQRYTAGTQPFETAAGDFDGDGLLDLLAANYGSDNVSFLRGTGTGFAPQSLIAAGNGAFSLAVADFNGDSRLDYAVHDSFDNLTRIMIGNGSGGFTLGGLFGVGGTVTRHIIAADFNNDGISDIAAANRGDDNVGVILGNGNGTFRAAQTSAVGDQPYNFNVGDLNGDGNLDLITADVGPASLSILLGTGTGTFQAAPTISGVSPGSAVAGDFNSDGVLDIAAADGAASTVKVHLAITRSGVSPLLEFSLKTLADARQALPVFRQKREQLAEQRGEIGAFQSRIDVARNVLEVSSENFRAAESRIRDADIAEESSRLVRLNILQQAAASVLAQANQQPALALRLLGA